MKRQQQIARDHISEMLGYVQDALKRDGLDDTEIQAVIRLAGFADLADFYESWVEVAP